MSYVRTGQPRIRVAQTHARRMRAAAGASAFPVDVEHIARHLRIEVVHRRFPAEDRTSGALLRREGSAIIVVNAAHPHTRKRFTVAHELGHFSLHDDEVHVDQFRNDQSSEGTHVKEVEANAFAAELLMPEDEARRLVVPMSMLALDFHAEQALDKTARHFGVSRDALTWRLVNLGLLS